MNYTDTQLKQALAKMLPDKIYVDGGSFIYWDETCFNEVLDTELLHLCWLVENSLTQDQCTDYYHDGLKESRSTDTCPACAWTFHADWQQRTIALAKIKGIEI